MRRGTREQTATDISSGLVYQTFGPIPASVRNEAEQMMKKLAEISPRPVIFTKVKVREDEERSPDQKAVVQGLMDVSGTLVRAQAAGPTALEGLRVVGDRLERRIGKLAGKRSRATKRPPSTPSGEWHQGDLPGDRPEVYDRPPEERRVVRRKTYSPADQISVAEALFDMDVLDYRFFLFTDSADGKSSIVYEDEKGATIRKLDGSGADETKLRPDVHINETPAPTIDVGQAVSHLNLSDMSFVFFLDTDQNRPSVLYRRYDGHYGLIASSVQDQKGSVGNHVVES